MSKPTEALVLVVEDDALIGMHLANSLTKAGFTVTGRATSAEKALRACEQTIPEVVLMDINLAGGSPDGVELARLLIERFAVGVVFLTSYSDAETLERAGRVGAAGFLLKPFEQPLLRANVTLALHSARLERERRETLARSRAAEVLQIAAQTSLALAHDLNNIVSLVHMVASLMSAGSTTEEERQELAQDLRSVAERAAALTRRLLVAARPMPERPQPLELRAVLTSTETLMRRILGQGVSLELRLPDREVWVDLDAVGLDQVLLNLLVNARQAMESGGGATLALDVDGGRARLRLTDSGVGIPGHLLPSVFDPQFSTRQEKGGLGYGLSTVRDVISSHGGEVHVESTPGRGSTFTLLLPLRQGSGSPSAAQDDASHAGVHPRGAEVLLAHPDPALGRATARLLERAGYTVHLATAPSEAIRVGAERPRLDLLLVDADLPFLEPEELERPIRRRFPRLRVGVLGGEPSAPSSLPKPYDERALLNFVAELRLAEGA